MKTPIEKAKIRACRWKRDFPNQAAATKAVEELKMLHSASGKDKRNKNLHAYKCDFCGKYHVGHFIPKKFLGKQKKEKLQKKRRTRHGRKKKIT